MITVSNDIKTAYNQYTTQRKSYIQVGNNQYFIQNMDLYADAYDEGNIVGNAIAKTLKFDIDTQYVRGLDEFSLYDGIWTGEEYEYINLGTFKLFEEQGTDDFFSSITAYDKLVLFNQPYDPEHTTYPTTVYGLLEDICDQANVTLGTQSIANGSRLLNENIFVEGETLKDILRAICEISGTFGLISNDMLKLKLKGSDTFTLSNYQISDPEYKRTTWKINQVVLGMKDVDGEYVLRQDDEDIELNGVHKIVINDNPFTFTQNLREEYIDELYNQLHGFGYIAYETKWEGLPFVELGDLVTINDRDTMVLRYELKSPDGLESVLSAPSIIDSVVDYYDNTSTIENRLKRTEVSVDKESQRITSLATEVNTDRELNDERILELTERTNSVEETITTTQETIEVIQREVIAGQETLKNALVTIDINGINVSTNTSAISTLMTNDTFIIRSGDTNLAYFGYDATTQSTKAEMDNLTVTNYLVTGYHRIQTWEEPDYGEQRTGFFWIGE